MSIALSVFPILLLIVLMIGFKMRGDRSAILAALSAVLIAIFAVPNVGGFTPPRCTKAASYHCRSMRKINRTDLQ